MRSTNRVATVPALAFAPRPAEPGLRSRWQRHEVQRQNEPIAGGRSDSDTGAAGHSPPAPPESNPSHRPVKPLDTRPTIDVASDPAYVPAVSGLAERREEEKERRRSDIIEAAEALYAAKGWDDVTMEQVARATRLSRALLYVYFSDKTDLHLAIVERAFKELGRRCRIESEAHRLGIDKLEAIGHAYLAFSRESPHLFDACSRFQIHQDNRVDEAHEAACIAAAEEVHAAAVDALLTGIKDGSIRRDVGDPDVVCTALWAFIHGLIQLASTKAASLSRIGVGGEQLMEQSSALVRYSLAPRPAG